LTTPASGNLIVGACLAAAAGTCAVLVSRVHADPWLCVPLNLAAVTFTAAVGFLSVPTGPRSAHVLLASAAAFTIAIALLRLTGCGTACLTAAATVTGLLTAISATNVIWLSSMSAAGASLVVLALAVLAVAPRLAITVTRVGPSAPSLDDRDEPSTAPAARVQLAHQILTGLVTGTSISAALGAVTVVTDHVRDGRSPLVAWLFTAATGLVLVLRSRTHCDSIRRFTLVAGGIATAIAGFGLVVISAPDQAHLSSAVAAGLGAAALSGRTGLSVGPVIRRGADIVEYLAIAAVIPIACWVGGLYGVVRGLSLI
jgi:type VII secretion integral membrane protein EccD